MKVNYFQKGADVSQSEISKGTAVEVKTVGNQHKWDSLGPERSGVGTSLGGLPEGPVMESSPIDGLNLHLDGRGLADY